jgi:hypothetical protein
VGRTLHERWSPKLRFPASIGGAPASLILAALVLWHNVGWNQEFNVLDVGRGAQRYRQAAEWTTVHLPPDAAIMAMEVSGAFRYYTDFPVVRWDFLEQDRDAVQRVKGEAAAGRLPLYAVLFPYEIEQLRFFTRIPGAWEQVVAIQDITVWHFTGESRERGDLKVSAYQHR